MRGDFYSSTGVVLTRVERTAEALVVESADEVELAFIGNGGRILATSRGTRAAFPLQGFHGYVRANVMDAHGHHAWVQPIRVP